MFNKVCVIGLGYIGIPTSVFFAKSGLDVIGVDINPNIINQLNQGKVQIIEPNLEDLLKEVVDSNKFKASLTPEVADAYIICVPTPFKENHEPDLSYIKSALNSISNLIKKGDLVILESTSPVGTTKKIAQWLQESRKDLNILDNSNPDVYFAYCPERMLPGNMFELIENDRIVGGLNEQSTQKAKELYSLMVKGKIITTNSQTAEMSKLTENSFRDVNIAFANELSMICDKLDIDVWELINLANHHPRVNVLQPGCGVGGHCIAVDPYFIINSAPNESKIIKKAREINDYKSMWVVEKVKNLALKLELKNPKVACFGLSFKPNIDDLRESPAMLICKTLAEEFQNVCAVEPNIKVIPSKLENLNVKLSSIEEALKADIVVLLVAHNEFKTIDFKNIKYKTVNVIGI